MGHFDFLCKFEIAPLKNISQTFLTRFFPNVKYFNSFNSVACKLSIQQWLHFTIRYSIINERNYHYR